MYDNGWQSMTPGHESGKEVYTPGQNGQPPLPPKETAEAAPAAASEPRRICGLKRSLFFILVGVAVVLILALAIGLGVGLSRKSSGSSASATSSAPGSSFTGDPDLYIGGAIKPEYYSTKGAFNGTGIALAGESWLGTDHSIVNVYFQHWSGQIRFMQLNTEGSWVGGTESEIVASDAKNSTPISTVAYAMNSTEKVSHLLCTSQKPRR
jgi:hypothetical protein